ncbi:MAG: hypothetical protein NT074_03300 [Methanomicrobiales archaeon]|nr:hypothetical protein [Methanomicrobiales archaeon]
MKKTLILIVFACGLAGFLITAGCTSPAKEEVSGGNSINAVKIGDILENPDSYNGRDVLINGKVVNQCGSGCWFFLDDGSGTIYVDLLPNNFAIPPMIGSKVTVEGSVLVNGTDVSILGTSVTTGLKVYS